MLPQVVVPQSPRGWQSVYPSTSMVPAGQGSGPGGRTALHPPTPSDSNPGAHTGTPTGRQSIRPSCSMVPGGQPCGPRGRMGSHPPSPSEVNRPVAQAVTPTVRQPPTKTAISVLPGQSSKMGTQAGPRDSYPSAQFALPGLLPPSPQPRLPSTAHAKHPISSRVRLQPRSSCRIVTLHQDDTTGRNRLVVASPAKSIRSAGWAPARETESGPPRRARPPPCRRARCLPEWSDQSPRS